MALSGGGLATGSKPKKPYIALTSRFMQAKRIGIHQASPFPQCQRRVKHAVLASVPGDFGCKQIAHFLYNFLLPQWHALKMKGWLGNRSGLVLFLDCTGKLYSSETTREDRVRFGGVPLAKAPGFVSEAVRVLGVAAVEPLSLPGLRAAETSPICFDHVLVGSQCAQLDQYNRNMVKPTGSNINNELADEFVRWRDLLIASVLRKVVSPPFSSQQPAAKQTWLPWALTQTPRGGSVHSSTSNGFTSSARDGRLAVLLVDRRSSRRWLNVAHVASAVERLDGVRSARVVRFEGLSLAEQMRQVRDVDVLMGVDGSGLANGNWLRNGSFVIDLVPYLNAVVRPDLSNNFRRMWHMLGVQVLTSHATRVETDLPEYVDRLIPWCRRCLFSGALRTTKGVTSTSKCEVSLGQAMWCLDMQDTNVSLARALSLVRTVLQVGRTLPQKLK